MAHPEDPTRKIGEGRNRNKPLTYEEVGRLMGSIFSHVAEHWDTYEQSPAYLVLTMQLYNDFGSAIQFTPEAHDEGNQDNPYTFDFNPKYPLISDKDIDDDLPTLKGAFKERFTQDIAELIYDAWGLTDSDEEPIGYTPKTFSEKHPGVAATEEAARRFLEEVPGTGMIEVDGLWYRTTVSGKTTERFAGFTTAVAFTAQQELIDSIRSHPRIRFGLENMVSVRARVDARMRELLDGRDN